MIRILVTGASGQLGLTLKDLAPNYPNIIFSFKSAIDLDITNLEDFTLIDKSNFDYCINCAAYTNVEGAEKNPKKAHLVNSEAVKNLAIACKNANTTLIHISTDYIFDGENDFPYTPDDNPNPINEYGKSKLRGEQFVQQIMTSYYIVRTSWLYSKIHGNNFYKAILEKARKKEQLKITDEQRGCPTNTESLSKFLVEDIVIGEKNHGIYHFTDGRVMTWFEFAQEILEENGLEKEGKLVLERNYRTFAKRPKNSVLSPRIN